MGTPNATLRATRMGMLMSQDDLARALREVGVPQASKRLVQRWESGQIVAPRPAYARALEQVLGLPIASLGFTVPIPGHDVGADGKVIASAPLSPAPRQSAAAGRNFSGVWRSRYEYYSSGREAAFVGLHHVVILQHGDRLTVRSLPGASSNPDSPLTMDLTVDGSVVTGTWVEQTSAEGYYRGARYHGAIQMLAEPTGRRMSGKWVGFGKEMDINTGPWELVFLDASTNKASLENYRKPPDQPAPKRT